MPAKPCKVVKVIFYITFGWCCRLCHHHDLEAAELLIQMLSLDLNVMIEMALEST